MRRARATLLAAIVLTALVLAAFSASAAHLALDAGVLQLSTFRTDDLPGIQDPCAGHEDASFCRGPSDQGEQR